MARVSNFFQGLTPKQQMGLAGGLGAAGGTGLGALLSSLSNTTQGTGMQPPTNMGQQPSFFRSAPSQFVSATPYNQQQQQTFGLLSQLGLQQQQNPLQGFEPIKNLAMSEWQKNILPQLQSLYAGADAQRSSSYNEALGQSGADLAQQLAALGSAYGLQQQSLGQNLLGLGLTPQYELAYQGRQPSGIESLLGQLLQGLGMAGRAYFAGGA